MKVLIAEDEAVSRHKLQAFLRKWDYEVISARDGAEAWQLLEKDGSLRLAVLDWMMPALEGTQVCQRIRKRTDRPYVYVILLTARTQKQDLLAGLSAGADDYLTKPFDAQEFRARLRVGERILQLQDDLLAAQEALRFQATHDALTGLKNRGEILEILQRELDRSRRVGGLVGVILADLDHFKRVNDTFGHLAGDAVLHEVSNRISSAVRSYDSAGRYGGEEFLIVVPASDEMGAQSQAERIRQAVAEKPVETPAGTIPVSLSLGVVLGGSALPGEKNTIVDAKSLLSAADAALYRAKDSGRNRVEPAVLADLAEAKNSERSETAQAIHSR